MRTGEAAVDKAGDSVKEEGRSMGIDYGRRRIGVAVSDVADVLATPLTTLTRRAGKRPPLNRLLEIADRHRARLIVVGLPLDPSGRETGWTAEVRSFGERLARRGEVSVVFQDERYSSAEAESRIRSAGLPRKKRENKARIDAGAAAIILQDWLDGVRHTRTAQPQGAPASDAPACPSRTTPRGNAGESGKAG